MADFYAKVGDVGRTIETQILDAAGNPIDITSATVTFRMWHSGASSAKVNAAATVVDGPNGKASYTWAAGDTDTAGDWLADWNIVITAGVNVLTVPTDGWNHVLITSSVP